MKAKRYFAIVATGFPGHPFPKFWDSFATLQRARAAAKQALQDGWRECEILRDKPRDIGSIGIQRESVEILRANPSVKRAVNGGPNYCAYKGETLFATIHGDKPNRANNRAAHWSLCYLTGRVEWFDTFSEAKCYALKG